MKRLKLILALTILLLVIPALVLAAGSVTATGPTKVSGQDATYYLVKWEWTADSGDGSVPTNTVSGILGYVVRVVTDPGSTAPTDNYDIELKDTYGCDVMGGALTDRDATATEQAMPIIGGASSGALVLDTLQFNLSNNSVNSATGTVYVLIAY